ncbi:ABC transporter permease [Desulfobacca acetoxidans]|uniref:ABC-type transporter, integral membrane subunit n=1 Tax=Desulfobacca acetoxidans (strain ATCC 700848 / DSM 11109 / ASRB2) TaxID=880072 RepID=F2NJ52_DESAR|nr:ABC transporter permease [Desulfobacca acetoxidans]AEB08010.1 ABC-type transporter, integral membrane subunit [Desulfobacca acetoxidans DSM 11109]
MYAHATARILKYTMAVITVVTLHFILIRMMPGDPLVGLLGTRNYYSLLSLDPEALKAAGAEYGLDRPIHVQYAKHMGRLLRGDLGHTPYYGKPVLEVILFRMKWTLILLVPAVILSTVLGGSLGALAGWETNSKTDRLLTATFLFLQAMPGYCMGLILVLILSFHAGLFPLSGMAGEGSEGATRIGDLIRHTVLPIAALVLHGSATPYIVMRSVVRQSAGENYVLTAIALGLTGRRVLFRHIVPNVLPTLITTVALECGHMVGGVLLVETVFSWQGMGTLIYDAVVSRDYPLLSGCLLFLTIGVIAANALADLACTFIDPRVRDGMSHG